VDPARGCFVSLHTLGGELRGCIGTFEAEAPLWRQVQEMAVAAASRDPRFTPLGEDELESVVLEISALTPRRPATPEAVRVGEHGLWVQKGAYRGVLLPQVATTYGWDAETFINQTCIKAGLAADAWRDGSVQLSVFSAEVFSESERLV
jgi:AmmeMemoRadiSam system protein A